MSPILLKTSSIIPFLADVSHKQKLIPFWPSLVPGQESRHFINSYTCLPNVVSDLLRSLDINDFIRLPQVQPLLCLHQFIERCLELPEMFGQTCRTFLLVLVQLVNAPRNDVLVVDLDHCVEFCWNARNVVFDEHLRSGLSLLLLQCTDLHKHLWSLCEIGQNLWELLVDIKPTLFCLNRPLLAISIAVKSDMLSFRMQISHDSFKCFSLFKPFGHLLNLMSCRSSNRSHDKRRVLRWTCCSELELVASVSVWTGSISVSIFLIKIISHIG